MTFKFLFFFYLSNYHIILGFGQHYDVTNTEYYLLEAIVYRIYMGKCTDTDNVPLIGFLCLVQSEKVHCTVLAGKQQFSLNSFHC